MNSPAEFQHKLLHGLDALKKQFESTSALMSMTQERFRQTSASAREAIAATREAITALEEAKQLLAESGPDQVGAVKAPAVRGYGPPLPNGLNPVS